MRRDAQANQIKFKRRLRRQVQVQSPTSHNPLKFWHENGKQFKRLYKVSRQILCAPASQPPVERLFSISGHILSQRRLRTSDKNFENILFANVNFEVFDAELRKPKQPDRDDDDANEWWNKSISNVFFVIQNGGVLKNGRDLKKNGEKTERLGV